MRGTATARKAILAGLKWGAVAAGASVLVRTIIFDEPALSTANVMTFTIVALAAAAATLYSNRQHMDEPS
ncbi:hypothetical protein ACIG3E_23550 [Streptomyces sp. NPDC053474]|uniref:hypothetical protein n=1 Tax=Streptomyces sp. NPDC053474 TaxID=3365704 RepID=UPI0037D74669